MKKKQSAGLTQELMEKLSQEAYCFNLEHENEITSLKAQLEALKTDLSNQAAKLAEEHKKALSAKQNEIYDLKDENEKLQDSNNTLGEIVADFEKKLASMEEETKKKFRKDLRCFDFTHQMTLGRQGHVLSAVELFGLSAALVYGKRLEDDLSEKIVVYIQPALDGVLTSVKRAVDIKNARALGEELRKDPQLDPRSLFGGLK